MTDWPSSRPPRSAVARVGVAAHDARFFEPVRRTLTEAGALVRDDSWHGHRLHHEPLSGEVADWADVLIAEWCLGNAVWHAARRRGSARPGRLVVRLHRFELETDFPPQLDMEHVDAVVFVGPHIRDEAIARFAWPPERCLLIPNAVDVSAMDRRKSPEARFTLGLLTWFRQLKRLDLALDLLERLRQHDPRFRLRLKGPRPEDVDHVWKYDDERRYFTEQYARIDGSPLLRDAVVFDPPGDDVPEWFAGVGHILSLSDVESFHLALAEGMASGAVPVIRDRPGAAALFGSDWVTATTEEAVGVIAGCDDDEWRRRGARAREEIRTAYDRTVVLPAWRRLILGAAAGGATR